MDCAEAFMPLNLECRGVGTSPEVPLPSTYQPLVVQRGLT